MSFFNEYGPLALTVRIMIFFLAVYPPRPLHSRRSNSQEVSFRMAHVFVPMAKYSVLRIPEGAHWGLSSMVAHYGGMKPDQDFFEHLLSTRINIRASLRTVCRLLTKLFAIGTNR